MMSDHIVFFLQTPSPVKSENSLKLESNPLHWSVDRVVKFIKKTDCASLAKVFKDQVRKRFDNTYFSDNRCAGTSQH